MQIMMVFGPSGSKDSTVTSLLVLDKAFSLPSTLTSTFEASFAAEATTLGSTCFSIALGSMLVVGFAGGAGLGWRLVKGFVSALLDGLLGSLDSILLSEKDGARSWTDGAFSGLTSGVAALDGIAGFGSGVIALGVPLGEGCGASSSSGKMRLFLMGVTRTGVTSETFVSESNFCSGLISRSEPCSILLL